MLATLRYLAATSLALVASLLVLALPLAAHDSSATTHLPNATTPYPLRTRGLDIQDGLRIFAKNLRIGVVIDDSITGEITTDQPQDISREAYINELAALYDFVWYFDGQVIRISPVGDIEIELIPLRDHSGATVIDVLKRLGLYQPKFIHRADPRSRMLMVSGPTSYTNMVREVATTVEEAERTNITLMSGNEGSIFTGLNALNQINSEASDISPPAAQN